MSYIDIFNQRDNDYGATAKIKNIEQAKRNILNSFFGNPSYAQVEVYTPSLPKVGSVLDTWIMDNELKKENLKKIQLIPNRILNFGDIIKWNLEYWIALQVDNMDEIYYRGSIHRCYSSLKWQDMNGSIQEAYFAELIEIHGLGLDEALDMNLPKEKRYIVIQNNFQSSQIKKNQRFILDNNRCWHVSSMNTITTNVIYIGLIEDEINESSDNVNLRVCDFSSHNYSLEVANGYSINLIIGSTLQIKAVTKDKGVSASLPVTYVSSNASIATVTDYGLITCISTGTTSVTVSLSNEPTISRVITIVINAVFAANSYSLTINGNDVIRFSMTADFNGTVRNNGFIEPKNLIWYLYSDDGFTPTTLAEIVVQTISSVKIKAGNKKGFVKLVGVSIEDASITSIKRIEIKSLIAL